MRILVVGGSGYIGSVLIPLLEKNHLVSNYDALDGWRVNDVKQLWASCFEQDVVIYLASLSNNDLCNKYPVYAKSVNQDCFPGVIEAAKQAGVKHFIYASSVAAYGSGDIGFFETAPLYPTTIYGDGKKWCEEYLRMQSVPYTIVRAATVCGWSPKMRWDTTVNKMVRDGLNGGITLYGGEQKRCHVHIKDLCEFYELILDKPMNQVFNVVWKNQTLRDTAYTVAAMTRSKVITKERTDDRSYTVSHEKAEQLLGWRAWRSVGDAVHDIMIHV